MKKYFIALMVLSVFLSEIIIRISIIPGFLLYSVLTAGVLIALSRIKELDNYGKTAIFLLILPMLRIAEIFIPLNNSFFKILIFYYLLFFLVIYYSFKFKIDAGYTKKNLILLPLAIFVAIILGYLGNYLLGLEKIPSLLVILPVIAFSEELFFRGLLQNTIRKEYSFIASVVLTSFLYSVFGLSLGIWFSLFMFFVSLLIGVIYGYTKNIFLAIAINLIVSFMIFVF